MLKMKKQGDLQLDLIKHVAMHLLGLLYSQYTDLGDFY